MYKTIISAPELAAALKTTTPPIVFDCTFDLGKPEIGYQQYLTSHIPGGYFVDLDKDLSTHDLAVMVNGGRHPLPSRESFAIWLSDHGVSSNHQVVVYDRNGLNFCGRLWWMLKWCGHEAVAVLDGGLKAWIDADFPVAAGSEAKAKKVVPFKLNAPLVRLVDHASVLNNLGSHQLIIDARAELRYRGEQEPLDPVAGHIPGAINRPFAYNFTQDGIFKSPEILKNQFEALIGGDSSVRVVHHCGSGVSAVPNIIAMELAGLPQSSLYAGSWSEWSTIEPVLVERG